MPPRRIVQARQLVEGDGAGPVMGGVPALQGEPRGLLARTQGYSPRQRVADVAVGVGVDAVERGRDVMRHACQELVPVARPVDSVHQPNLVPWRVRDPLERQHLFVWRVGIVGCSREDVGHHGSVPGVPDHGFHRAAAADGDGFGAALELGPAVGRAVKLRLLGMKAFPEEVAVIAQGGDEAPGDVPVVSDVDEGRSRQRHARRLQGAVSCAIGHGPQVIQVPDAGERHPQVDVVAQERMALRRVPGVDGPAVAALAPGGQGVFREAAVDEAQQVGAVVGEGAGDGGAPGRVAWHQGAQLFGVVLQAAVEC